MLTRRRLLVITGAACLAGPSSARTRWQGRALGADASIELKGDDEELALKAALDTIARMEKLFSLYDPNSELSRLNRDGFLSMSPEFAALLNIATEMNRLTTGLFDPTIQPLWTAAATGGDVDAARDLIGWDKVEINGQDVRFLQTGMAMTLNGIAQGFATDRVRSVLRSHGFRNVIVNIGEYAVGSSSARLGISRSDGEIIHQLKLQDEAVATSSPCALPLSNGLNHIVSPMEARTSNAWDTVSVVAPTAAVADALSTGLCLTSNEGLARKLKSRGSVGKAILVRQDGSFFSI